MKESLNVLRNSSIDGDMDLDDSFDGSFMDNDLTNIVTENKEISDDTKSNLPKPSFLYLIVSFCFVFPVFRILFRGRTYGKENLPKKGLRKAIFTQKTLLLT